MKLSDQKINCHSGFSLLELLIVIVIVSLLAGIAIPMNYSGHDQIKLQTAADELASLLRYARDQGIQKGHPHGVHVDFNSDRIYGFISGSGTDPLSGLTVLYHPISKLSTDIVIPDQKHTEGVSMVNSASVFGFADRTNQDYVLFDETGLPYWKGSDGVFRLLVDSEIKLTLGGDTRTITLKAGYGRVTIQ